jgi:hypothetical protein
MKIVINNNGERIPATLEVVDGVMIVSPTKDEIDISQFNDGDVVAFDIGIDTQLFLFKEWVNTTTMLSLCYAILDDETGLDIDGGNYFVNRIATEEEKQKFFDALEKSGYRWDAERKEVVQFKWKPYIGEIYYYPMYKYCSHLFKSYDFIWADLLTDNDIYNKGWCFKTKEECETFCKRLNEAIEGVKP